MFQFHTPGSKAIPFTFLAYRSCTLKNKTKTKQEFIACMLPYSKPNQTWWNELKHFEVVVRKGPFWVLFPSRAADQAKDLCVFWGTHSKERRDTKDLLSSVHCLGLSSFWSFTFLWGLVLFPSLAVWAGFCLLPFQGLHFWGWNVVTPDNFSDLRSVENPHGNSLQCHAWQEDFCSSTFLLYVGKRISPGLFAETACRMWEAAGRREKLKRRCGTKGGSPPVLRLCVQTWEILSSCCCSQQVWQLPVGCWARLLAPISPSLPGMNEWTCVWPHSSTQQSKAWET